MEKSESKVIDLNEYKIERSLRKDGFTIKRDEKRNINVLLKINNNAANNR